MLRSLQKSIFLLPLVAALSLAAPAGRPNLQLYLQSTQTDVKYQKQVFDRFAQHWHRAKPLPALGSKAVVQAVLSRDGKVVSAQVTMPSGSSAWDQAALEAVKKGAPYPALPAAFPGDTIDIHFHVSWDAVH